MKKNDIALIIMVVVISGIFALVISNLLFKPSKDAQQAEQVDPISAEFKAPDATYFNSNSIDPTQTITIGDNTNPPTPFN